MNATAYLHSNSIKTSCPSRLANSAFVTGRTVINALTQLYARGCGWALCRGSSLCFSLALRDGISQRKMTENSAVLLAPEDLAFLDFKDIYSEISKAALKAGQSNSHSSNSPKLLKILTLSSPKMIQYPHSHPDNQDLPTCIYSTGGRRQFGTYISALHRDLDHTIKATKTQLLCNNRVREAIETQKDPGDPYSLKGDVKGMWLLHLPRHRRF